MSIQATFFGNIGSKSQIRYYWLVPNLSNGATWGLIGPVSVTTSPGLDPNHVVLLNWDGVVGASSYTVLSSKTSQVPSGKCALTTTETSTSYTDNGGQLLDYNGAAPSGTNICRAIFDVSVDGGKIGQITPKSATSVPAGAMVYYCAIVTLVTPESATGAATIGCQFDKGADPGAIWTGQAPLSNFVIGSPLATAAYSQPFILTDNGQVVFNIQDEDLTAGKLEVIMPYIMV